MNSSERIDQSDFPTNIHKKPTPSAVKHAPVGHEGSPTPRLVYTLTVETQGETAGELSRVQASFVSKDDALEAYEKARWSVNVETGRVSVTLVCVEVIAEVSGRCQRL